MRWPMLVAIMLTLCGQPAYSQVVQEQDSELTAVIRSGLNFLKSSQAEDGTFSIEAGPGITALAVTAVLRCGESPDSPLVQKGLSALETFVKPDGGIYGSGRLKNYETCIGIICFVEANRNGKYNQVLAKAKEFVTGTQYGSAGDSTSSDVWNGGIGYGEKGRPDLSNTAYMIEALIALEAAPEDPTIQAALEFVSRCQNLASPHNTTEFASKIGDGSFYYMIPKEKIDPSEDEERYSPNGGIYGYGTMTYAGYKSMIYAGLSQDDPRVSAALKWIAANYSLEKNPRMGSAGLYYYYQTFSTALEAARLEQVTDAEGKSHDWRKELVDALAERQGNDGSWSNANSRWFENDKNLCTSFALLALANCQPEVKQNNE